MSFDHDVFASECFQRLAGILGIAALQSPHLAPLSELEQLSLQLAQDEQADTSRITQVVSHLLLLLCGENPGLQYTAADYKWLCQQIEQRQWSTLLKLISYAAALAAQTQARAYLTPSDLAQMTGESEAAWRQRLRQEAQRFLAAKVGPGGTWIIPQAAALAHGLHHNSLQKK
jgi:hypothetical protein